MKWQPPAGMDGYLKATKLCDSDHPEVKNKAQELTKDARTQREAAVHIFNFVRDQVLFGFNRLNAKASETLKGGIGFCITKSNLQAALLRAVGIPARYHQVLLSRESLKDLVPKYFYKKVPRRIPWHTWCECHLSGKWVECEPLFDKELYNAACKKGIINKDQLPNIDWDGEHDLIMVAPFILEDKGRFHNLDDVFEKAYEETRLPGIIYGIALYFTNRYTDRLRQG